MSVKRRDFMKGCATVSLMLTPALAASAKRLTANNVLAGVDDTSIQKSIKAGFGDGFLVRSHTESNGWVLADIEHLGARYKVASVDLLDWQTLGKV